MLARMGQAYESGARVYPRVVSECSAVWCPSVGCTDLRARSVSECREQGSSVNTDLDLEPRDESEGCVRGFFSVARSVLIRSTKRVIFFLPR